MIYIYAPILSGTSRCSCGLQKLPKNKDRDIWYWHWFEWRFPCHTWHGWVWGSVFWNRWWPAGGAPFKVVILGHPLGLISLTSLSLRKELKFSESRLCWVIVLNQFWSQSFCFYNQTLPQNIPMHIFFTFYFYSRVFFEFILCRLLAYQNSCLWNS